MSRVLGRRVRSIYWTQVVPLYTRRGIQIRAAASDQLAAADGAHLPTSVESRDARFDVIGSPYSLLSVSLSASQNLFTRRGTLVGLSGKADNVVSTLSVLEPFRRAIVGVPFLYQKISSTSPVTALISVRSPVTSFAIVHLNGSVDWMVAQRRALLAWTGYSMSIHPTLDTSLSVSHWGSSKVAGRGLLAVVGSGQLYSVELKQGEQYLVHPSNVVAYTLSSNPPRPYRFKSTTLSFQVPQLKILPQTLQNSQFIRDMAESGTWETTVRLFHRLRTWFRRAVWGDKLFLQFDGPATLLIQSRGARLNDIMSAREVDEIASAPRGVTMDRTDYIERTDQRIQQPANKEDNIPIDNNAGAAPKPETARPAAVVMHEIKGVRQSMATITKDGKVEFKNLGKAN